MGGKIQDRIISEGVSLYKKKSYAEALAFFVSLSADSGADKMETAYYLGLCYAKLGKYDDALLYLEQVVTTGGQLERVQQCRFLLAIIYDASGRKRLAEFELNKLLETGYMPASVYAAIAYIAWEQSDTEKCLSFYEKSLKKQPDNISSLNGLGYVLACEDKDLTRALALCKKAVDYSPDSAACLDSLGWVYFKLGLYKDAMRYLEKALLLDNQNPVIAEHMHHVARATGKE
jgi:tetratricopeptide (TPR) repeat protein